MWQALLKLCTGLQAAFPSVEISQSTLVQSLP
jgi:hypothetical protein